MGHKKKTYARVGAAEGISSKGLRHDMFGVGECMPMWERRIQQDAGAPIDPMRPYVGRRRRPARWRWVQLKDIWQPLLIFGAIGLVIMLLQHWGILYPFTGVFESTIAFVFALALEAAIGGALGRHATFGSAVQDLINAVNDTVTNAVNSITPESIRTSNETRSVLAWDAAGTKVVKQMTARGAVDDLRQLAKGLLIAFGFDTRGTLNPSLLPMRLGLVAEAESNEDGVISGITNAIHVRGAFLADVIGNRDIYGALRDNMGNAGSAQAIVNTALAVPAPPVIVQLTQFFTWVTLILISGNYYAPFASALVSFYGAGAAPPLPPGDDDVVKWVALVLAALAFLLTIYLYQTFLQLAPYLRAPFQSASENRYVSYSITDQLVAATRTVDATVDSFFERVDIDKQGGSVAPATLSVRGGGGRRAPEASYGESPRSRGGYPDYV